MTPDYEPLVTVYITSHNYGQFLGQAIESVLHQTLRDFELIIIDDGSTDNSRDIIAQYETHDQIIPILQKNNGLNVTNNIAASISSVSTPTTGSTDTCWKSSAM